MVDFDADFNRNLENEQGDAPHQNVKGGCAPTSAVDRGEKDMVNTCLQFPEHLIGHVMDHGTGLTTVESHVTRVNGVEGQLTVVRCKIKKLMNKYPRWRRTARTRWTS